MGPFADNRRVVILANPRAGTGRSLRHLDELLAVLRGYCLEPEVCWRLDELSARHASGEWQRWRCVVAAGGDGTLLEVVQRAPGVPAALLPLGNENLVARYFGVPRSGRKVAALIASGCARRIDLGSVNGRPFCAVTGVGVDGEVVHRVHARRKGHINKLSYAMPILQSFGCYRYPSVEVTFPETGEILRGAMVFVFNVPRYAMGLPLPEGADPADGLLDVYVFQRPGLWHFLRYFWSVLRNRQRELPDYWHRAVRRVSIRSDQRVPVQTDGDPGGHLPLELEALPGALTLLVPH